MGDDPHVALEAREDREQAPRVVVVAVAQNDRVDALEVDAQRVGIGQGGRPGAGVEEKAMLAVLHQDAQAPLAHQALSRRGVLGDGGQPQSFCFEHGVPPWRQGITNKALRSSRGGGCRYSSSSSARLTLSRASFCERSERTLSRRFHSS